MIYVINATIRLKRRHQPIPLTIVHHDDDRATVQTFPVPGPANEGYSPTVLAEVGEDTIPVVIDDADEAAKKFVKGRAGRPPLFGYGVLKVLGKPDINRIA